VSRFSAHLTRRRGVGLLGLLGAASTGFVETTEAKKKKQKKKKPSTTQPPATQPPCTPNRAGK
jgi:hypothetical protein